MCADFRVKCEVEVRGLTAPLLYAAYRSTPYLRFLAGGASAKSSGQHCRERCLAVFPFSVRGQSITVFTTRPDDPRQPLSFVWEERGRRAGHVRTKRADNVEVPKLLRTFAMIETYGN